MAAAATAGLIQNQCWERLDPSGRVSFGDL